ncbi:MAG TPA: TlpA family protein disulfide reductase [Pseudoclavibacter sp.]|nr:TlpA family protein disulfide reductase [Pseudoclavibacter sp.]
MRRYVTGLLIVVLAVGVISGCSSSDPLAEEYRSGGDQNYISGDGSVVEFAAENRGETVEFSGVDQDGNTVTSDSYQGNPVVVNFWYAACAPCRAEAGDLEEIYQEYQEQGVDFLGVNVRDSAETASAFMRTFSVSYPSVIDTESDTGGVLLDFSGYVAANTVPTTIVLDSQGRVSARISGSIEPSTLRSLIDTVVGEN